MVPPTGFGRLMLIRYLWIKATFKRPRLANYKKKWTCSSSMGSSSYRSSCHGGNSFSYRKELAKAISAVWSQLLQRQFYARCLFVLAEREKLAWVRYTNVCGLFVGRSFRVLQLYISSIYLERPRQFSF